MLFKTNTPIVILSIVLSIACSEGPEGSVGPPGEPGIPGPSGVDGADGVDGVDGADGTDGTDGAKGPEGEPGTDSVVLAPEGVVGKVRDRSQSPVSGGNVYFVPANDVAELPETTIDPASPDDEPLEDLIAANENEYQKAAVDSDGSYRVEVLEPGSYFVTFVPDASDSGHLPGGSACRKARTSASLLGTQLDLEVSAAPPADAYFTGSGRCVTCHGKTHVGRTLHRLGIWSPYEQGPLQNQGERAGEMWAALDDKFTVEGTTIYYYDHDPSRGFDKYKTAEEDPGANVSFTVTVFEEEGAYKMLLHNVKGSEEDRVYPVDVVYGGGLWKQRYLARVTNESGFFHAVLPVQYNSTGQEEAPYGRTSKVWRDYHGQNWYDETAEQFKTPTANKSFEKNCISCHANGVRVTGSDATTWTADLLSDPIWGDFDYDGDSIPDEVNMGCETCHGPGSEHWAHAGQGKAIVSPSLLTPEREAMICGQCHSRPQGALGTDSPVNSEGWMMRAGTSRAAFLAEHATTQLDGSAKDFHADERQHSKSHHQQYSDFIRSGMYKNGTELMTCTGCHDPHERENPRQLRADPSDENGLCGDVCHAAEAADKIAHIDDAFGFPIGFAMKDATCMQCHMTKTAKTGAGEPGATIDGVGYWMNDVSSHLFDVPGKVASLKGSPGIDMPTPYTDSCGQGCHIRLPE